MLLLLLNVNLFYANPFLSLRRLFNETSTLISDHIEVLPVTVKPTTNSALCEADGNMQLLLTNYAFRMPSSKLGIYRKASVSSDAKKCATVGK